MTHRAVQKAIAAGRIAVTPEGKVDAEAADRAWASNTDESKPRNSVSGTPRIDARPSIQPTAAVGASPSMSATGTASGYQAARAMHESYRARNERLKYERLSGTLVALEDVRIEAFTAARRVREAILSLPDRLAPVLAAMGDAADIHRALSAELRQALEELSREQRQ